MSKKIEKILENIEVPSYDENEKKIALNLAMSEFATHQKEKEQKNKKTSQGFLNSLRLIFIQNKNKRREKMAFSKKKLLATVCVSVLSVGALMQLAEVMTESFGQGGADIGMQNARNIQFLAAPAQSEVRISVAMKDALVDYNEQQLDKAERYASSTIPAPVTPLKQKERSAKKDQRANNILADQDSSMYAVEAVGRKEESKIVDVARNKVVIGGEAQEDDIAQVDDIFAPDQYTKEGRDKFEDFKISPIKLVSEEPVSTFSVDVDTTSYSFMRKQLTQGRLPQKDAIRIEELVNYFNYNYPLPETTEQPFKPSVVITPSPWAEGKKLVHIGIKGYDIDPSEKPRTNLVFLLDVSGSMNNPDKLPLVKQSMNMLLQSLNPNDTVGIVVYAGAAGAVLEPTPVSEGHKIIEAIGRLRAGGGTAGGQGIELAYKMAEQNFDKGAINRIILATDGDFNVGIRGNQQLQDYVERKREKGIFLSVLGFGQGNYNDHLMQVLAQNGNGVAAYIDNVNEAKKVLVQESTSTLFPIAKDVKIQLEFNPDKVAEYRLIGYETRELAREDFNNDAVDAGDIGSGHTVTAIYEITPVGSDARLVDDLRYGKKEAVTEAKSQNSEFAHLKIRYKLPNEDKSKLITRAITASDDLSNPLIKVEMTSELISLMNESGFATAVASFAQILKDGKYTGEFNYDSVIKLAEKTKGEDKFGYRAEFIELVKKAKNAKKM